jgi:hypothetical protein
MKKEIIDLILNDYKNGINSIKLSEKYKICKKKILNLLKDSNLLKKRDRCKKINITQNEGHFIIDKLCPSCNFATKIKTKKRATTCRNYYNALKRGDKCKKCSLELQKGAGNPFFGKKHSEDTKNKISHSRKGKAVGDKNAMAKYENRKKLSESLKKSWSSGKLDNTKKKMSDVLKKTRMDGKIKSVIKSKKEKEICTILKEMGYTVISSLKVDTKICDVYILEFNLIIEYFGDYWHCNPQKYSSDFLNKKKGLTAKEIWDYDKMKLELIKSYGYNLEVIWESELKLNNEKLITIIKNYDTKQ